MLTTFTVVNNNDDGGGSLRDAIDDTNNNAGSDTIEFASSLYGMTIYLTSGQLELTDTSGTTTIVGLGAGQLAVSGNGDSRVFKVDTDVTAQISGLTIRDGYNFTSDGGGIVNDKNATLTITGSTLSGNLAKSNGGGINNSGDATLTITNSTFSGNSSSLRDGTGGISGTFPSGHV